MKKLISLIVLALCSLTTFAQKDVTTFLGIPVNGTKSEMQRKLIGKGYVYKNVGGDEFLSGEFNGTKVNLYIVTNNNKVYRIMVADAQNQDEANIKIRFNRLVSQFQNNKRYTALDKDFTLSDKEDISYGMSVNNKTYEASFYQNPENIDTIAVQNRVRQELLAKYSEEQLKNPTDEINEDAQSNLNNVLMEILSKKFVWFRIYEHLGEYYICMYYDNEYNHANGEDL